MAFLLGINHKTINSFVDSHFIGGMTLIMWGMKPPSPSINYGVGHTNVRQYTSVTHLPAISDWQGKENQQRDEERYLKR